MTASGAIRGEHRLLLVLIALGAPGCAFLTDRGEDFLDIFHLDAGPALGLGIDFQATDAVHSGLERGMAVKFGLRGRGVRKLSEGYRLFESSTAFLVYRDVSAAEAPIRRGYLWNFIYWPETLGGEPSARDWRGEATRLPLAVDRQAPWLDLLDVDLGIMVAPLGARVGFSPGQALDFVLGWAGIDLAGDDGGPDAPPGDPGPPRDGSLPLPANPSFPVTMDGALAALRSMRSSPRHLERPVVVLGGFLDSVIAPVWAAEIREATGDPRALSVTFATCWTFAACRSRVVEEVDRAFPPADPVWTREVDVIGISMGGLVGCVAAAPPAPGDAARRLKVRRLFTVSSPLRGARLARLPALHPLARDMRAGSGFLARLERARAEGEAGYGELFPYTRLEDAMVGEENAAPPGEVPWWLPNPSFQFAHFGAALDPRLRADVLRRLRGETPFSTIPRAPLPAPGAPPPG